MSDENTTADDDQGQEPVAESTTSETETEEFDPARAMALIGKLREELRDERKNAKAIRTELDGIKTAGLSETERLHQELDAIRTERDALAQAARTERANTAARTAAAKAGAIDPDAVATLISARITFDDDGAPVGIDAAVKDLRTAHPALFPPRPGTADAGKGRQGEAPNRDIFRTLLGG